MLIQFIQPDFSFEDGRGSLVQLVRDGYKQINVVSSKAGVFRGGHYHALNQEVFYVITGRFSLLVSEGGKEETYEMKTGDFFAVPPFVVHSFTYLEDTLLLGLYDRGVELPDGRKDIISWEENKSI